MAFSDIGIVDYHAAIGGGAKIPRGPLAYARALVVLLRLPDHFFLHYLQ